MSKAMEPNNNALREEHLLKLAANWATFVGLTRLLDNCNRCNFCKLVQTLVSSNKESLSKFLLNDMNCNDELLITIAFKSSNTAESMLIASICKYLRVETVFNPLAIRVKPDDCK